MAFTLGAKAFFPRGGLSTTTTSQSPHEEISSVAASEAPMSLSVRYLNRNHSEIRMYIDCIRGKHDRLFIVSEHYTQSVASLLSPSSPLTESVVVKILFEVLLALAYLHRNGIVHRNLSAENVMVHDSEAKLADYGLYHMTDSGLQCHFPIGYPSYYSPEVIQAGPKAPSNEKADIWAVGVLAAEMINGSPLFANTNFVKSSSSGSLRSSGSSNSGNRAIANGHFVADPQFACSRILDMCRSSDVSVGADGSLATQLIDATKFHCLSDELQLTLRMCLAVNPKRRPPAQELLMRPLFEHLRATCGPDDLARWEVAPFTRTAALHRHMILSSANSSQTSSSTSAKSSNGTASTAASDPLAGKPLADIYHLWKLAGGSVEKELAAALAFVPPVCRLPAMIATGVGKHSALLRDRASLYSPEIRPISLASLRDFLNSQPAQQQLILIPSTSGVEVTSADGGSSVEFTLVGGNSQIAESLAQSVLTGKTTPNSNSSPSSTSVPSSPSVAVALPLSELPALSIREKDVNYQRTRMKVFRELLAAYPATERQILEEARVDIPPMLRDQIWAVLLGVYGTDVQSAYDAIDKDSEGPSDHQIDLDVPRCHQYNELLASPEGHRKLKRILKAWVRNHQGQLVYWQGLDSLLAPFLALNLNNEALAWACLEKTVEKFTRDFFRPDNSLYMQQQLLISRQLLAYHDPELAMHLHTVGFNADMYAIPWFLTLFAHSLSLDKVCTLWDTLLLGSPTLAHFITLAILREIRSTLLPLDLNACILFFSHLPELDISEVVRSALRLNAITPPSITTKRYALEHQPDPQRWWLARVPLEELSQDMAPRVSVIDLLKMPLPLLVLDIRRPKEFEAVHFDSSVILDHKNPSLDQLEPYRGNPIVIVANKGRSGPDFANILVRKFFPYVIVLHGGIDALRRDAPERVMVALAEERK